MRSGIRRRPATRPPPQRSRPAAPSVRRCEARKFLFESPQKRFADIVFPTLLGQIPHTSRCIGSASPPSPSVAHHPSQPSTEPLSRGTTAPSSLQKTPSTAPATAATIACTTHPPHSPSEGCASHLRCSPANAPVQTPQSARRVSNASPNATLSRPQTLPRRSRPRHMSSARSFLQLHPARILSHSVLPRKSFPWTVSSR